ncbi:hypothetical protein N7470_004561 [Penicillium chermesinum]|nr:hypothetical protein N7470_004561 [Penicillium chermesinum]
MTRTKDDHKAININLATGWDIANQFHDFIFMRNMAESCWPGREQIWATSIGHVHVSKSLFWGEGICGQQ